MMHKGIHLDGFSFSVKPCLAAFILLERMQFVDEKAALILQDPRDFRENEDQVRDVLQHKITDNEIEFHIITGPAFCNVSHRKSDILCAYFRFGLLYHSLGKIERVHTVSNLGQKRSILPRSTADL